MQLSPLSPSEVQRMTASAFPDRVSNYEILSGGLINTNLKVHFENGRIVVLRIYRDGAATCRKEFALHNLVKEAIPVAKIIHAEPNGVNDTPAFAILEYVGGPTFQQLKRTNDREAIAQASYSVGKTLAAIGRFQFEKPGRIIVNELTDELSIGDPFIDDDDITTLVESFLQSPILRQRTGPDLTLELQIFFRVWSRHLPNLSDDRYLVHCDFGNGNIMVFEKNGRWEVSAVLDWELAFSGSPLLDVGHFLRYDYTTRLREPYFSRGFLEHEGKLPDNWQPLVRVIDLTGLIECLTHDELPIEVESEILQLVRSTLLEARNRQP